MEKENKSIKKSLCRYYLRGLCIYKACECRFSHGISDLDYSPWTDDEVVQYDYLKKEDFCQRETIKGPLIYKNLFEFQTEKVYSLEQLNENRPIRAQVRNLMHQKLFQEFIYLLESIYPQANFTQEFLVREYTRAGFNKLMTRIKFSHLTSYLCEAPGSLYFKTSLLMPPLVKRQTSYIVRRCPESELIQFYKMEYQKIIKEFDKIEEAVLKKLLFNAVVPNIGIMPLNLLLKEKKMPFPEFLKSFIFGQPEKELAIKYEASIQSIFEEAKQYINKNMKQKLVNWNDIYNYISKELKINNGNILNQVKPLLVLEGYKFLFFPMAQFVYHKDNTFDFKNIENHKCQCNFQDKFSENQLMAQSMNWKSQIKEQESVDIHNFDTTMQYAPHILKSKILAIDLEGSLRKGGFVEMIQLNNGRNTFLIDIWHLNETGDFETFWLIKKILRNVLVDPQITKIFHDCRHDSLGLHQILQSCIKNVFDTSAVETLKNQLKNYQDIEKNDAQQKAKKAIAQCTNIKTPGLNEIYKRYNVKHGINANKQKFHKMWSKGDTSLFMQRPMDPEYREYCIKDVLDLPEAHDKMISEMHKEDLAVAFWISSQYSNYGYENSTEGSLINKAKIKQ